MEKFETIKYRGAKIKIYYDSDAESPRIWDNLGKIYYSSNRYVLGDENSDWETIAELATDPKNIVLTVSAYIHSGVRIWTNYDSKAGMVPPSHRGWDSGVSGIIVVSKEDVYKEYGWKRMTAERTKQVYERLDGEIKTFGEYLEGEVYGYMSTFRGADVGSCWGFFGDDGIEQIKEEAKAEIDHYLKDMYAARWAKLKELIRASVPFIKRSEILNSHSYAI